MKAPRTLVVSLLSLFLAFSSIHTVQAQGASTVVTDTADTQVLEANPTNEWIMFESPVIDMHAHTGGISNGSGGLSAEEHYAQSYEMFEKYNVVKAVVSGPKASLAMDWFVKDEERIIPGSMVGLGLNSVDYLRAAYEEGNLQVIGEVGFYYNGLSADDEQVQPYFALAEELGIPMGYHLMDNIPRPDVNSHPSQFQGVLDNYPNMKIYLMHAGFPHTEEIKELLANYPQVYVDISWIASEDIGVDAEFAPFLEELIDAGYGKRIMFGSDTVMNAMIFDNAIPAINDLPFLTNEQKADIFYYNAARFLGLSDAEINQHWNIN